MLTTKNGRYLLLSLNDMRSLPDDKKKVYHALCKGELSVQMSGHNTFGGNKVVEQVVGTSDLPLVFLQPRTFKLRFFSETDRSNMLKD